MLHTIHRERLRIRRKGVEEANGRGGSGHQNFYVAPYPITLHMETNFIKKHGDSETFIIKRASFFDTPVHLKGNLIVGNDVDFWSDLAVTGSLELAKGVTVKGSVRAGSAIIGAHSRISGDVTTEQNCAVLDHAIIGGNVMSGGNVMIRPNTRVGVVNAAGDIEIMGKTDVSELHAGKKIIARKDLQ